MSNYQTIANILVVDDTRTNLHFLTELLSKHEYDVRSMTEGHLALASAKSSPPDLILLDVIMPGMSGYEVCEQLKADERTCDIPVIFISAVNEVLDKVKAFSLGGVDYITRPFHAEEVLARIQTHLHLRRLQKSLKEKNARLQREIDERKTERKQAKKLHRNSEKRFRSIFENATTGIFQATLAGRFMAANPALAHMLGYTSAQELLEVVSNIGEQIFVESQHWFAMKSMLQVIREVVKIESRCQCKDGREIIVNLSVWSVHDDRGKVRYFEGFIEDITERKRAQAALTKRETYLATLVEAQRQLLAFESKELPYDVILRLLGTVSHTSRAHVFKNHGDAQGHLLTSHLAEWCAQGISPEITNPKLQNLRYDDCIPRWAEVLTQGGVISGIVANFPEQEWRFLAPLEIRSILVLPLTVNGEFFGFIGFDDCREARIWSPSEVSLLQAAAAAISLAKEQQLSEQQVQQHAAALQNANQELAITLENLKTTQQELIHSEKMAALGQLVAGVAHEINSPLGAIRSSLENISQFLTQTLRQFPEFFRLLPEEQTDNFSALLAQSLKKDATITAKEQREFRRKLIEFLEGQNIQNTRKTADILADMGIYENVEPFLPLLKVSDHLHLLNMIYEISGLQESVQIMTTATERASKVVFALRTYAHHDESHAMVQADIIEGIETVLTLYHNQLKQGVEVVRQYEALQPIFCYPDELNQVWTNLIHNAIQAMKGMGKLEITVSQQSTEVIVRMVDSGCGIPEDIKARIFEPFFTTKSAGEGSGLGLDIVKKIIDKHQGNIAVDSQPGRTAFTVVLPIVTANV